VIGLLDAALLLPLIIAAAIKLTPPSILENCRQEAIGMWNEDRPKKYLCALPVAGIWLAIIIGIIGAIMKR